MKSGYVIAMWLSGCLVAPLASAATLEYAASLDQSVWRLTADSPVECRLEHFIPGYGSGAFVSRAGKQINLDFELRPLRPNAQIQTVTLRSIPPTWRPGMSETSLSTIRFYKQFDGLVQGQTAWTMMGELEQGRYQAFMFRDWYHRGQSVQVSVSSVGFYARYQSFLMCLQGLLPYTFEDIAFTALTYEKNSDQLTPYSQRRLEMIAQFLKADRGIDMLVINAYTDSLGARWPNQKLSEKRAAAISQYFTDMGIAPSRIEVQGHGEKQHIASNETEAGRAANRRVVISMSRSLPVFERRGLDVGDPIFTGDPAAATTPVAAPAAQPAATPAIVNGTSGQPAVAAKAAAVVAKPAATPAVVSKPGAAKPPVTPAKP